MKKYSVIIPAHNEELYLEGLLQSLCSQTIPAEEIVLINDNSTDKTEELMKQYASSYKNINYLSIRSSNQHLPGAKVVRAFNYGLENLKQNYDVLVKLDSDLVLPKDYFEKLLPVFKNPKVGIAGGFCYEQDAKGHWSLNHPMEHDHVRGAFKAYSKECFKAIQGLSPAMGWDTLDELLARYNGFSTKTLRELKVKHLRPLGAEYSSQAKQFQGAAFYSMRYGFVLSILASLKHAIHKKSFRSFFHLILGFLKARKNQIPFLVNPDQGKFIRNYRWNKIWSKSFFKH